ncbi:regulator component [Streptomyces sp. NPDC046876]|uniref:regulator component n=1 Tax=Streptomyces sp. NPDC046876 TaxID=3155616 RepID=UPI0033C2CA6E
MPVPRGLRRRCEGILAGIELPDPFTVDSFRDALARHRGRPIVMEPLPELGFEVPCGAWIALPSVDVVFYEQKTSPAHQDLIKLHELGHVLCGHTRNVELADLARAFGDLTPDLIAHTLGRARSNFDTVEEQEAEMIAVLLADLAATDRVGTPSSRRLAASLAHPIRRLRRWRGD